ncbi:hypothetical protein Tco_0472550 [Tanacetum coccineum]
MIGKGIGILHSSVNNHGHSSWNNQRTLGTTPEGGCSSWPEESIRTYDDLNDNDKKRFDADVRATNIVLQGLPKDIYKLINHNIKAKSIWDNVKMLLAGSELTCNIRFYSWISTYTQMIKSRWVVFKLFIVMQLWDKCHINFQGNQRDYFLNDTFRGRSLVSSAVYFEVTPPDILPLRHIFWGCYITKEDSESQLYDEFERFKMLPGENINEYYVWFYKLINDMRNIRMTMPNIQLNSKFVNNMSSEWDRFVTVVKLNKGLKETNHKQLAYLKQHKKHAAQDRLIIEKITPTTNDPLAFVLNVQPYAQLSHVQSKQHPSSSTPLQSPHVQSLQYSQFPESSHIDFVTLPQTNNQLRTSSNTRNQATVQDGRVVVQNVQGRHNQNQRNFARGAGAAGNEGAQNRAGNANASQGKPIKCYNCNGLGLHKSKPTNNIAPELVLQPEASTDFNFFKDTMLLMQDPENDRLKCDAFDSDVDDEPTAQSIFMANLSSTGPTNLQVGPSNASILSEVHDLEYNIDHCDIDQDEHEIHNEVQQKNIINSNVANLGNSNIIPYEQYLFDNEVSVKPSCAPSVPIDASVLHDNNAYIPHDPLVTELSIYKQQVAMYEQHAKFDLTLHEQKMDEQMRMLIQDRNKKEENLKNELHYVKLQLNSTIKSNMIIEETVTALKHEFKQKETKFLTDFSNLKTLNDKLENKLYAQDQSIQTVHMMLKPKKLHDHDDVTAVGAQNPFYLRKAKVAQPALYDGDEILKTHHVPVSVTSSEEDLEIAEITRQKMNEKMNDPVCVEKRIKIIPPNYSKENFLATFTPQTQLTPEQVFWSNDLLKQRAEALKANSPPLPILPPATVYPPNTPVHLVPRTLPTTSQVNIGLYVITQLFWDFEKTCKKRITPTGITEGERGFEQTKRCYLTEVIPFFNLLKEHFEEVQRSLVKEVRAMKAVFENMEAEVDQNAIDKKCGEIERKNLLITNENLIANCIAQDVFYTVTDSALSASRFHDLSTAYNVAMTRVVELESENSKLLDKIQHDSHDTMVKDFSKLEVAHLNLQLKYQHLKENIENFKSKSSKDVPEFDTVFELDIWDDQTQGHRNTIRKLKAQISQLKANKSDELRTLDYKSLNSQYF